MSDAAAVDADGHITESTEQLRPYFEGNYGDRGHWAGRRSYYRSEVHTSELQSRSDLVCRLLLEKKKYLHPEHSVTSREHHNTSIQLTLLLLLNTLTP